MDWDTYFLNIACETAKRTKCLSRAIGAVLVAQGKFVAGTGFNGPPIGVAPCKELPTWHTRLAYDNKMEWERLEKAWKYDSHTCPRRLLGYASGEGLHLCMAAHAERNAIDLAARMGHSTLDCALFLSCGVPCLECSKTIIQAGVTEVVVTSLTCYEKMPVTGLQMLREGGVKVRTYHMHPTEIEAILKEKGL